MTPSDTTTLLEPFNLSGLRLPNRIVMAPMSRGRAKADGRATASMATYFAQRATAGLIVTDGIWPNLQGKSNPGTPGLADDNHVQSWRPVTTAVHANGGRIFAQLMHGGRIGHADTSDCQPVGPSPVAARNTVVFTSAGPQPAPVPRELSTAEAAGEAIVYATAARRAIEAGFDGVELHGANGYLINQFLSTSANRRADRYGGSVEGRIRFAVEAAAATADAIGGSRVGIRLSPGAAIWDALEDDVPEMYGALLTELAKLDLAYVHLTASTDQSTMLELRRTWPGALIVSPVHPADPVRADQVAATRWRGLGADLVSFARAYLANPDLVERFRGNLPLAEADLETYYTGGDRGFLTYGSYQHEVTA